ncbi:MAG: hypothetical protein EOP06_13765, partial [Proteobacteria bacterium]
DAWWSLGQFHVQHKNYGDAERVFRALQSRFPESELGRIYEQFYRVASTDHPHIKGTGLGLSLVKRLCDLLHIGLGIASSPTTGTVVTLRFR